MDINQKVAKALDGTTGALVENSHLVADVKSSTNRWNIRSEAELERVKKLHTQAEKFDARTEKVYESLQVFTAICCSFSHGANDVANAIGPFAAIYAIYTAPKTLQTPYQFPLNPLRDDPKKTQNPPGKGLFEGLADMLLRLRFAVVREWTPPGTAKLTADPRSC